MVIQMQLPELMGNDCFNSIFSDILIKYFFLALVHVSKTGWKCTLFIAITMIVFLVATVV